MAVSKLNTSFHAWANNAKRTIGASIWGQDADKLGELQCQAIQRISQFGLAQYGTVLHRGSRASLVKHGLGQLFISKADLQRKSLIVH